jgi:hypothetical protein
LETKGWAEKAVSDVFCPQSLPQINSSRDFSSCRYVRAEGIYPFPILGKPLNPTPKSKSKSAVSSQQISFVVCVVFKLKVDGTLCSYA